MPEYESNDRLTVGGLTSTAWALLRRMPRTARATATEATLLDDRDPILGRQALADLQALGLIERVSPTTYRLTPLGAEKLRSASGVRER